MTEINAETVIGPHQRRFSWVRILPQRRAWIQTLILLPFGLPMGNFLGSSFHLAVNAIVQENNYLLAIITLLFSCLIPVVFFAFCWHWLSLIWKQQSPTWYPQSSGLWAGIYATIVLASSFGIVSVVTNTFNICDTHSLGSIGHTLLCNLDRNYGFEPKSWFGAWFIIAAYLYQAERWIKVQGLRLFKRRNPTMNQVEARVDLDPPTGDAMTSGGEG
jgi:hypothetical protein